MANVPKGPSDVTGITGKVIESVTKVDGTGSPTAQPFTEIRRNNVYQVTARVGKIGIQILNDKRRRLGLKDKTLIWIWTCNIFR